MIANKSLTKRMWHYFFTGLFVLIPVWLTVSIVVWVVHGVDKLFGSEIPGLGLLISVAILFLLGLIVSSTVGQLFFELFEEFLLHIPGVSSLYKTSKALTSVFSPNSQSSFRHVVAVEYPHPGALSLGFVTSEINLVSAPDNAAKWISVYVPTNHMYLGNVVLFPQDKVFATDLSVAAAIQITLAGGASFPDKVALQPLGKP